jgi:hypothetical protein
MTRSYRKWTHDEDAQLLFLHEGVKMAFGEIDRMLKRHEGAAGKRYKLLRPEDHRVTLAPEARRTSNIVLKEAARVRQIACAAAPPASLTAAFFGDPPPGRSALDKRRMASP